jgi:hypothetical protein
VERTDGTTASFLKEVIRRAVLEALHEKALHEKAPQDDPALTAVTGAHLPGRWMTCLTRPRR